MTFSCLITLFKIQKQWFGGVIWFTGPHVKYWRSGDQLGQTSHEDLIGGTFGLHFYDFLTQRYDSRCRDSARNKRLWRGKFSYRETWRVWALWRVRTVLSHPRTILVDHLIQILGVTVKLSSVEIERLRGCISTTVAKETRAKWLPVMNQPTV